MKKSMLQFFLVSILFNFFLIGEIVEVMLCTAVISNCNQQKKYFKLRLSNCISCRLPKCKWNVLVHIYIN